MEWYLPITIMPGIGMLIFSTTNQMLSISSEVGTLLSVECTEFQHHIASLKIKQIKRLTFAGTLLYSSAGFYVLSGIFGVFATINTNMPEILLILGTLQLFLALILLVIFSFNTIKIRQLQFKNNHLQTHERKI